MEYKENFNSYSSIIIVNTDNKRIAKMFKETLEQELKKEQRSKVGENN